MKKHKKADSMPFRGDQLDFSFSPFISPHFAPDKWSKRHKEAETWLWYSFLGI
jgi:hypothetical protein